MPAYAALSLDAGRLEVAWQLDGDIFTMSWTVREGPSVSAPKTHGFGTTVIERMAESSLGGPVDHDYAPSVRIPAEAAHDSGMKPPAIPR